MGGGGKETNTHHNHNTVTTFRNCLVWHHKGGKDRQGIRGERGEGGGGHRTHTHTTFKNMPYQSLVGHYLHLMELTIACNA